MANNVKLKRTLALKRAQRNETLILQFPSFDDAREIKSVWLRATLALRLLIANFSCN